MIVGTAGHIDHGKTTLVRALTGVDTDRLPEEKKRGITIDLGFAPLELPEFGTVGVVDVPGHEDFVRTMLAGAAGIDVGLLVIAADDGVQPQTREHLAILQLLGVRGGVIALTKCDIAEPDWIDLVEEDVRGLVAKTAFASAPVVRVAPGDAAALAAIRDALSAALRQALPRDPAEPFRLPVDRVFTVRGTGTVVTGTTWSGSLARDAEVHILPSGARARVRGVQVHGHDAEHAQPGQRTAIALGGVEVADIHRGDVVTAGPGWEPALVLRADVSLLPDAPRPLGPRTSVRLHLGTAEIGARVVAAEGALEPGQHRPVRVVLDAPVVARAGDRFVLRSASPALTIGGGVVTDAHASRRSKPFATTGQSVAERLGRVLDEAGPRGVARAGLSVRLAASLGDVTPAVDEAQAVLLPGGDLLLSPVVFEAARERLLTLLDAFHREHPLATGTSLQDVRARLKLAPGFAEMVVRTAVDAGEVETERGDARRAGWKPALSEPDEQTVLAVVSRLAQAGAEPPSTTEIEAEFGPRAGQLLPVAAARGLVVQVERGRYYASSSFKQILEQLGAAFAPGSEISPSQIRELIGVSRKYVVPLLEYLDGAGWTSRRGESRVWTGRGGAA